MPITHGSPIRLEAGAASPTPSRGVLARLCGRVGRQVLRGLGDAGRMIIFVGRALSRVPRRRPRIIQTIVQVEFVGARSVGVVALSAVFTGLVARLLASVVVVPLLTALFSMAGIAAAYFFGVSILGLDRLAFMSTCARSRTRSRRT